MKWIHSSYSTSLADCYDVVTWASHCTSRNGAHWYNLDQEAMLLGKLFILKADMSNFPSNSHHTSCDVAGRCADAVHSPHCSHLRAVIWLQSWLSLFLFHSVKTTKYSYLPISCGMTPRTKFDLWGSTVLAAHTIMLHHVSLPQFIACSQKDRSPAK